jgi:hypothetical protein
MSKSQTQTQAVAEFVASEENKTRQSDARVLLEMMERITGLTPKMWGDTLIGFDSYHYKYDSGHEGDSFIAGFSPRKARLVIYINPGFDDYGSMLERLGKYKSSVSCLYINKLADVDMTVLEELVTAAHNDMKRKYHG